MATITKRKRKNGTTIYYAQIRIWKDGKTVYTESESFDKHGLAKNWAARRETELKQPNTLEEVLHRGITIKQVLIWYRDDFDGVSKFGRSKLSHINFLINYDDLASLDAIDLTTGQLVSHVRKRRESGAGASTVNNDLIWLRNAYRTIKISRNIPLNVQIIDDTSYACRAEKLVEKSNQRNRRPTVDELNKLLSYFKSRDGRATIPMTDIVLFALFSSRRQDEICRIEYEGLEEDFDIGQCRVLVKAMKHPRKKVDTWVILPLEALAIVKRQPNNKGRIFPFNSKSVSSAFTLACKFLGIEDLVFHDLRHECTSWLFEQGWDIPRVSKVTGHKSWTSLQRYTHFSSLTIKNKYKDWEWRPK